MEINKENIMDKCNHTYTIDVMEPMTAKCHECKKDITEKECDKILIENDPVYRLNKEIDKAEKEGFKNPELIQLIKREISYNTMAKVLGEFFSWSGKSTKTEIQEDIHRYLNHPSGELYPLLSDYNAYIIPLLLHITLTEERKNKLLAIIQANIKG